MKKISVLYTGLILLGCIMTLSELILSALDSSLCSSTGCRVIESYLRFDESFMYAIGFLFFAALFLGERKESFRKYGPLLLMFALAAEGYLIGFQLFVARTVCPFCIVIASLITLLALIKLIDGAREQILAGCMLFALIFSAVYSINASSAPISSAGQYVLIYSKDCTHCEEVISFSKEKAIPLTLQNANDVKGALKLIGLDSVPVLVCNDADGKKIYSGAANIKTVLTSRFAPNLNIKKSPVPLAAKEPWKSVSISVKSKESIDTRQAHAESVGNTSPPANQAGTVEGACSLSKLGEPCK